MCSSGGDFAPVLPPTSSYDDEKTTKKILQKLKLENYQLGKTKVFLGAGQIGVLDSRRAEVLDAAAKCIQGRLRTFVAHRDFVSTRVAVASFKLAAEVLFHNIVYI
ncbi:Protein OPAQUE1 [Camellia lanceoleosa]|uniref:Protein OPAQUE1 n=1 Tax=Camellia lanceoleosa TaxID=1840588 RepID=A0ACC0HTQ8_9ERIC|nr:Protein OPAQUE1 [Camellia lanceoleosa]